MARLKEHVCCDQLVMSSTARDVAIVAHMLCICHLQLDTALAEAKTVELSGTLEITLLNSPPVYFTEKKSGTQRGKVT